MFEREITLNQFLVTGLQRIAADLPDDRVLERAPGNGHPPIWVLGHLAICAELGLQILGSSLTHPQWLRTFGPGSSDDPAALGDFSKNELLESIVSGYPAFCDAARQGNDEQLSQPHGVALLDGTGISTQAELVSHLLTSHFAFHLSQLSSWRRAQGHAPLF